MNSNCELEDELRLFCSDPKNKGKFFIAESFFVVVLRAFVRAPVYRVLLTLGPYFMKPSQLFPCRARPLTQQVHNIYCD